MIILIHYPAQMKEYGIQVIIKDIQQFPLELDMHNHKVPTKGLV